MKVPGYPLFVEVLLSWGLPVVLLLFEPQTQYPFALTPEERQRPMGRNGADELPKIEVVGNAFDTVIANHPEDVWAKNGRAQVLKAQGHLPAALAAFDSVIASHPQDVVAKNGRAEVLKAQGDLTGAREDWMAILRRNDGTPASDAARANLEKLDVRAE